MKKTIAWIVLFALCSGCATQEDRDRWRMVAAVVAAGAMGYAAARSGGGGYSAPVTDYDWDWDQFFDKNYNLVWACRGIQTGQFADQSRCAYKLKVDNRWPNK